ncbi:unnamed protein product [Scytosiphon promiscuus]
MHPSRIRTAALTVLATTISADASFSNVKIAQFEQAGLDLSFLVSWDTADSAASVVNSVDIWLETRQGGNNSGVETILEKGIENAGSFWIDAGDSWALRSSWDSTSSGEAIVCIYNSSNIFDNACGEGLGILPEDEAPSATPGEGITNVDILSVDQNDSSLAFSVTWTDGGGAGGLEDTALFVDVWLFARQSDPPAWVELPPELNVGNEELWYHKVEMDWSTSGWELHRDGELQSCVYDAQDYDNYACSDFVAFTAEDSEGAEQRLTFYEGEGLVVSGLHALVLAGGLVLALVAWLAVTSSRQKQRRKWLGTATEAEALPEDVFIRPSAAFSGFQ